MSKSTSLIVPILVVTLGVGWLLTAQGYLPAVNWIWTLGLAVVGILILALSGIDKLSIVIGPFFLAASLFSVLRQSGRVSVDIELPILVIVFGVLLGIARLPMIPHPKWVQPEREAGRDK